ncbi:MAG: hypothetical protein WEE36_08535 [Acidimicrobiia bacterium]
MTPTTDIRSEDIRVQSTAKSGGNSWGGLLIIAVIVSAIILAIALAGSGGFDSDPVEPNPTDQPQ